MYQHRPTFGGGFASQHLNIFPTFRGEMPNIQYQPLGESKTIFSVSLMCPDCEAERKALRRRTTGVRPTGDSGGRRRQYSITSTPRPGTDELSGLSVAYPIAGRGPGPRPDPVRMSLTGSTCGGDGGVRGGMRDVAAAARV